MRELQLSHGSEVHPKGDNRVFMFSRARVLFVYSGKRYLTDEQQKRFVDSLLSDHDWRTIAITLKIRLEGRGDGASL